MSLNIPKRPATCLIAALLCMAGLSARARRTVNIWSGVHVMRGERVLMEITMPERPNGTAVIICPGGSYHHLGFYTEGRTTADWFASKGVVACLLSYRVAQDWYHYPAPMQDVQRAIQLVREQAEALHVDPERVGLIGFSAGGHLVAWAGECAPEDNELHKLGIPTGELGVRPNFVVPVYPVVTMQDDIGHRWSRRSLLGRHPTQAQKDSFSLELHVGAAMPPVYLVACKDDPVVIYENSVRFFEALERAGTDCTFASYEWGGHGFGMQDNDFMKAFHWNDALEAWLTERGFLPQAPEP